MDPPASFDALVRELADMKAELARLEKQNAELEAALAEIEHESRRCNDALERAGWRSGKAETRDTILAESRRMIVMDRENNRALRVELARRMGRIQEHLKDAQGNEHDD